MAKKILIIITKGETGGAQMSTSFLAEAFAKAGHEVTVGFGEGDFLKKRLEAMNAGIKTTRFSHLKRSLNPFKNILWILEVKNYLKKNPADVVHFNSSNALLGAIGAKMVTPKPKTIFTFRGLSVLDPTWSGSWLNKLFYRLLFRALLLAIDESVYVSEANERYGRAIGITKKSHTIYNGINPETIHFEDKTKARAELGRVVGADLQHGLLLGSIGRLAYQKNYEFLIEQFPKILDVEPSARLVIVGDGPEREHYKTLIRKYNLEETILLAGDQPGASRYMKAFDIFTLPSRFEGMSITILEAMFAGLPTITTDVGGAREQLGDAGYLYPLDDETAFFEAFEKLRDEATRKKQSEMILARSKQFDVTETARKYLALY